MAGLGTIDYLIVVFGALSLLIWMFFYIKGKKHNSMFDVLEEKEYPLKEVIQNGDVQIADEVVAIIAGLAATEVEGVAKMSGNIPNELVSKLGMKNLSKGVKVEVEPPHVSVILTLVLKYGYSIPKVSKLVQERVKNAIETMTGLEVVSVNIRVANLSVEQNA
jgi:uncharacterized alkaline shock family protein YloU